MFTAWYPELLAEVYKAGEPFYLRLYVTSDKASQVSIPSGGNDIELGSISANPMFHAKPSNEINISSYGKSSGEMSIMHQAIPYTSGIL